MKIITIVGTRPEIIRLSRVISKFDSEFDHVLVHTGQNYDYELNEIFFKDLEIRKPDYFLNIASTSPAEAIGNTIIKIDEVLDKEKPQAILVLGDTNSCLSVIAAKRKKIPIFHMEAGNRCFDARVPEEINRKIVDHCSDINLTYSSLARENLLKEGMPSDMVIKIGSPMMEVLKYYDNKIKSSRILEKLKLKENNFFLISCHREENIDDKTKFVEMIHMLNHICKQYDLEIIFSTHPRTRKRIENEEVKMSQKIRILKPLSFTDYNKLQISARLTLSDSGTINEESSILNFPAVNIRDCHERPEAMEEASVMMVGFNIERIDHAITLLSGQLRGEERTLSLVNDYRDHNISEKVARIVISYIDYINRKVWYK